MTAKSREENPATQANARITKMINFLHPALLSMKFSHIMQLKIPKLWNNPR